MSVKNERVLSLTRKVRNLLSQKGSWVQSTPAQDAQGRNVQPRSEKAVSFCLSGAVEHLTPNGKSETSKEFFKVIYRHLPKDRYQGDDLAYAEDYVVDFNDSVRYRRDVLRVLDRSIRSLEQETKK